MKSENFAGMKKQETPVEKKVKNLENEMKGTKIMLPSLPTHKNKKIVKLSGALKGMKVAEEDLEEAKHALLRSAKEEK